MPTKTLEDPGFLDSIGKLKQTTSTAEQFGSELLNALPQLKVKNEALNAQKEAIRRQAMTQTTNLVAESDEVFRRSQEARSTPFYDVIAFFSDEPSFEELDAKQNLLSTRMNRLSAVTDSQINSISRQQEALQANLNLRKQTFAVATQQLQLETQSVSARATAAANQKDFASQLVGQMSTGDLRDIQADVEGRDPRFKGINRTDAAKQLRIREEEARIGRQGAKAKREEVEQNFFESKTLDQLRSLSEDARTRNEVIPIGAGFTMSPRSFLARVQQEQDKFDLGEASRAESAVAAGNAFVAQIDTQGVLARETQGNPTLESTTALSQFAFLNAEFEKRQEDVERANATGNPAIQKQALFRLMAAQSALSTHGQKAKEDAIARAQAPLASDASKQAAADYVGTGKFQSDLSAAVYVDEIAQIGSPEMVAVQEDNFALRAGVGAFLSQLDLEKQKALGDPALNPKGELDQAALMASMFSNAKLKPKIGDMVREAISNATIEREGESISIQDSITDSISRGLISTGIQHLAQTYGDNEAVLNALNSVLTGDSGSVRSELNNSRSLLNALAVQTAKLRQNGDVDKTINLATEMRKFMVDPETYQNNSHLLTVSSPLGAALDRYVFANNMQGFISKRMPEIWRVGANDDEIVAQEEQRLQVASEQELPKDEKAMADLRQELAANAALPHAQQMAPIKRLFKETKLRNLQEGAQRRNKTLQLDQ